MWGLLIEKLKSLCRRCLNRDVTNGGYRDAVIFGRIPRADLRARSDRIGSIINHTALIGACYSRRIKTENNASDEMITPGGIPGRAGRIYVSIKFTFPTALIYRYLLLLEAGETGVACAKEMYLGSAENIFRQIFHCI